MSNFSFLAAEWSGIFESAKSVEELVNSNPRGACFYARYTLEQAVKWIYAYDKSIKKPYDDSLGALIHEPTFQRNLQPDLFQKVRIIQSFGNLAVHTDKPIKQWDALQMCKGLFHVLYWMARTYTRRSAKDYADVNFDEALVPQPQAVPSIPQQSAAELSKLEQSLGERDARLAEQEKKLAETDALIAQLRQEIAEAKKRNQEIPDEHDYSEAETRGYYIDVLLREVGWDPDAPDVREYPVTGMPNTAGVGAVDYVLWDDNGLPLAVVEAKRTSRDPEIGRQQAKLYADCLERKFKQRPIIFYSNGYSTWLWDDSFYPPRRVQGFYKKDELQLMVDRRTTRKDLASAKINTNIVDRYYQEQAIRAVTEDLSDRRRKALVVMATGAGKTRTVIALCELLQRCNWAKRILFLADRKALVRQAVNAFKKHMPESSPVNLLEEKDETGGRVLVSTYPTMMGLIDETDDGIRRFSPGHFDLVIIDEAHRSVYQKYRAIFEYFDGLLVGLTATPRAEVDRDTYGLFELERGVPTYAFELDEAVARGFLVPPREVPLATRFLREGARYDELSEEEREQWDELDWGEDGFVPDAVDPAAFNSWLFNADTVDKILAALMTHGRKVAGGDRLGKTIIFAKNHKHAEFIAERFDKSYPHYQGHFARIIDNFEPYAHTLLDDFTVVEKAPHIAISVDMLDTGVDVPEVVNLVYFKMVRSRTKFYQMLGRGTRLSPDLFGPDKHKECFYVFDCCGNFDYFRENPQGIETSVQPSLGKRLFTRRLDLVDALQRLESPTEHTTKLCTELKDHLCGEVAGLNPENFLVRPHRSRVERFGKREAWDSMTQSDYSDLASTIAGLGSLARQDDETAKRFDLLILSLQLALLNSDRGFAQLRDDMKDIVGRLEDKSSIPVVNAQMALILEVQTDGFWADITLAELERARKRLRDLIKFIEKRERKVIYSDFEDELHVHMIDAPVPWVVTVNDLQQYRKKVRAYLNQYQDHIVLRKLKSNRPLSPEDLAELERLLFESGDLGSKQNFEQLCAREGSLSEFIRNLVGLDREAVLQAFSEFLSEQTYTATQIDFVKRIIDYLTKNGIMDPGLLYEPPYTDYNPAGLDGVFRDEDANKIVALIKSINSNAVA